MSEELSDLLARLGDMTDATKRHLYDIGDYWNVCEEAEEVLKDLQERLLATAPVAPSSPPKCEECVSHYPSEITPTFDTCRNVGRRYDYCANERSKDGPCGPSGHLFVKKGCVQ